MSVILIVLGVVILYSWWRLLFRISDEKVHRHFASWWTQRMPKEEAEGFQVANGVLFSVFILLTGIVLVFIGIAKLFG
jgi:multisubunit Na+/H+ antiporter MnhB subunit